MADLLKAWLRARLGVIMDLTPETFGRYTRDGTLLAQILHNYDIISSNQLSTIVRTYDPALCRVNLKTLRIWLKLINVALSDECIEEISKVNVLPLNLHLIKAPGSSLASPDDVSEKSYAHSSCNIR